MIIDKVLMKIARMTSIPHYVEDVRGGITTTKPGTGGVTVKRD